MNDEQLHRILRAADDDAGKAPRITPEGLLNAALARRRRTSQRRAAAVALGALFVFAVAWIHSASDWSLKRPVRSADRLAATFESTSANPPAAAPAPDVDAVRRELVALEREAQIHLQVVRGLTEAPDSIDAVDLSSPAPSGAELARLEVERSAAISWRYATLIENEFHDVAAARHEYQRLAERFPDTEWADLAAASLDRLSAADAAPSNL